MTRRKTFEEVVKDFRSIHGDKFDYSKMVYVNNETPVTIICPIHGEFSLPPNKHFQRKQGCKECDGTGKQNTEKFIEKAKALYGTKFDYSKTVYTKAIESLVIGCPTHGNIEVTPHYHLKIGSHGCPHCGNAATAKAKVGKLRKHGSPKVKTEEHYVEMASKVHGDLYSYPNPRYEKLSSVVYVVCKDHGEFKIHAGNHLRGTICQECALIERGLASRLSTSKFVEKVAPRHKNKYNYDKCRYIRGDSEVIVTCPKHGDFDITPEQHMNGRGCPDCATYGFNKRKDGYFYVVKTDMFTGFGISNKIEQRLTQHMRAFKKESLSYTVTLIASMSGESATKLERLVKIYFSDSRVKTKFSGFKTEALAIDSHDKLLRFVTDYIKENLPEGRLVET